MKSWEAKLYKAKWLLLIIAVTLGVYLGFRYLLPLILPFIFAYFLAWIIRPVTEALYRKFKIPRIIGGSLSLILLVAVFGTALCLLINILIKEAIEFIRNIPIYLDIIAGRLDSVCKNCDQLMGFDHGTMRAVVDENILQTVNRVKTNVMPRLTERTISISIKIIAFTGVLLIVFIAAVLIAKELPGFHERFRNNHVYKDVHRVTKKLTEAGIAYLRCQLIIMSIVAVVCFLGLTLLKNNYAVLLGVFIAFLDALPILGIGLVLIPWAVIMLINGSIYSAAILMTTFLICQVVREVLEPKLIGNRIGVKPLFTLIAMYIGLKLFGIAGFILGPIGLIVIITIYKVITEKAEEVENTEDRIYN